MTDVPHRTSADTSSRVTFALKATDGDATSGRTPVNMRYDRRQLSYVADGSDNPELDSRLVDGTTPSTSLTAKDRAPKSHTCPERRSHTTQVRQRE